MTITNRLFAVPLLVAGIGTAASAVTFSNITLTGISGTTSLIGNDGLAILIPSMAIVGATNKTITIEYDVTANPGMVLCSTRLEPNGMVISASADISASHPGDNTALFHQQNPTDPVMLGTSTTPLVAGLSSFHVTSRVSLTGFTPSSVAKMSIYNVFYTECVPEPGTVAAMVLGLGGLVARRIRRAK